MSIKDFSLMYGCPRKEWDPSLPVTSFLKNNPESSEDNDTRIVYSLRHKRTGLYYKPGKKNLSKVGKIYPNKNTALSYFYENRSTIIIDDQGKTLRVTREDFELVPFKLVPLD